MTYFYIDPLLDNVRDDSRFKDFIEEAELKLQREQEMVKTWLDIKDINLQVSDSGT
jgi:hypothetical protein